MTFEEATKHMMEGKGGLGFVFTENDDLCGIDLDDCIHGGMVDLWAEEIIDKINSYAEISPSGTGVHIICKAHLEKGFKSGDFEAYCSGRYFTMTFNKIRDMDIQERQKEVNDVLEFFRTPRPSDSRPHKQSTL